MAESDFADVTEAPASRRGVKPTGSTAPAQPGVRPSLMAVPARSADANTVAISGQDEFRRVMGHFATGVTVMTSAVDGDVYGMTVNAFASLSLEPLLVMVGLSEGSRTYHALLHARRFGINILASDQHFVSSQFASKAAEVEKFRVASFEMRLGVPILHGTLGWLICDVVHLYPGGDHLIGVGHVIDMCCDGDGREPLLFYTGRYHALKAHPSAHSA